MCVKARWSALSKCDSATRVSESDPSSPPLCFHASQICSVTPARGLRDSVPGFDSSRRDSGSEQLSYSALPAALNIFCRHARTCSCFFCFFLPPSVPCGPRSPFSTGPLRTFARNAVKAKQLNKRKALRGHFPVESRTHPGCAPDTNAHSHPAGEQMKHGAAEPLQDGSGDSTPASLWRLAFLKSGRR